MPTQEELNDRKGADISAGFFSFAAKSNDFKDFIVKYLLPGINTAREYDAVPALLTTFEKTIKKPFKSGHNFEFNIDEFKTATGLDKLDKNDPLFVEKVILNLQIYSGILTNNLIEKLNTLALVTGGNVDAKSIIQQLFANLDPIDDYQKRLILEQIISKITSLNNLIQPQVKKSIEEIKSTINLS